MDIIKTGLEITRTIKNVARLKEIISVLARNGFDEFIVKTGLHNKIPNFILPKSHFKQLSEDDLHPADWWGSIGHRLRLSFEELGPGFIKLGQLLSTREDMFDPAFIDELKKLRDKVAGIPFSEMKGVLENSLGKPWQEVFSQLEEAPMGTASIGVVYKATLKTGEAVVVKIRRPNIVKSIEIDFDILHTLVLQLEKVSKEFKLLGISRLIHDFGLSLKTELDFRSEAQNCQRLKENIAKYDQEGIFFLPRIFEDYTSEEVIVMERVEGIAFTDGEAIIPVREIIRGQLEMGVEVFIKTMLSDGFFHADLHGGNFFLMDDRRIGVIDFGLVGSLSRKNRINLVAILYALITHNYENLVYEFLDVAEYDAVPDVEALIRDVKDALSPFVGLTVKQMDLALLLRRTTKVLTKHALYLPREWFIVFRAMITLDGVGRSLDMDFDIFSIIDENIRDIIKSFVTVENAAEELAWSVRDTFSSLRVLPRHARWFLKELSKRKYAIEVVNRGYNRELKHINASVQFLGLSFIICIFIFLGAHTIDHPHDITIRTITEIPFLAWIYWLFSIVVMVLSVFILKKSKR